MVSIPRIPGTAGQLKHRCPCLNSRSKSIMRTTQGEPVRHLPKTQEPLSLSLHFPVPQIAFALAFAIMGLMLLTPRTASAQASAGITGTVTDTSGAVVRGAHVTLTNEGTGSSDHTVTESAGTYSFKGVLPSKYTVSVEAAGFKKEVKKGVNVEVSTTPTVDMTLSAGAANET